MPELPEVEAARRSLERWTLERTIVRARVPASRLLGPASPAHLRRSLVSRTPVASERLGKHLLLHLDDGAALHVHLGMTGKLVRLARGSQAEAHARVDIELDDGNRVVMVDPRAFGRLRVGPASGLADEIASRLGPDPLRDRLGTGHLYRLLQTTRRPVKVALMSQELLAGLGNIQAQEALFLAQIHPGEAARALSREQVGRLEPSICKTLRRTLRHLERRGVKYLSEGGDNIFYVYGRSGSRCSRCGSADIERIVQSGRSTHFCPCCQAR